MLLDQLEHLARVGEQPQIERRERREMKIAAARAVDRGAAAPVCTEPRTEAVVVPAGLRLDAVAGRAAKRARRLPVQIIELGHARTDGDLVDESDGVGQRELDPSAVAAAEWAAAAAAPTEAAAGALTPRSRP